MEQPKKKVLLTAKRVKEVADSLEKEYSDKKILGNIQKNIAEAFIKKGEGEKQAFVYPNSNIGTGPTNNQRMEIAKKSLEAASRDSANAARYRKLADAAKRAKINR
jgi:hypothetical protein